MQRAYNCKFIGPTVLRMMDSYEILSNPIPDLSDCIYTFCISEISKIDKELNLGQKPLYRQHLVEKRNYYVNYMNLIGFSVSNIAFEVEMQTLKINSGTLTIPSNWIVVNPNDANACKYALIAESKCSDLNLPYFVILIPFLYSDMRIDLMKEYHKDIWEFDSFKDILPLFEDKVKESCSKKVVLKDIFDFFTIPLVSCSDYENVKKSLPFGAAIIN